LASRYGNRQRNDGDDGKCGEVRSECRRADGDYVVKQQLVEVVHAASVAAASARPHADKHAWSIDGGVGGVPPVVSIGKKTKNVCTGINRNDRRSPTQSAVAPFDRKRDSLVSADVGNLLARLTTRDQDVAAQLGKPDARQPG